MRNDYEYIDRKAGSITIQVQRSSVVTKETAYVNEILNSFISNPSRNRNRVCIEILGYDEDPRELFDIPEVRLFFQKLFDENDGAFFWIDPDSHMLLFWGLMLLSPYRCDGKVGLQPEDMQKYLYWGYYKLNVFCQKNKLSPDFSTKAIGDAVKHFDFEFCISS